MSTGVESWYFSIKSGLEKKYLTASIGYLSLILSTHDYQQAIVCIGKWFEEGNPPPAR